MALTVYRVGYTMGPVKTTALAAAIQTVAAEIRQNISDTISDELGRFCSAGEAGPAEHQAAGWDDADDAVQSHEAFAQEAMGRILGSDDPAMLQWRRTWRQVARATGLI